MKYVRSRLVVMALVASPLCSAEELSSPPATIAPAASRPVEEVAAIAAVKARDTLGRVARFMDARGREFKMAYDSEGRLISANATLGEHISQVKSIAYDSQGRLAGALIGVSYMITVNYLDDGTQILRDRFGALIARRGDVAQGYVDIQVNDPSGRLLKAVSGLDALMRATVATEY